MNRMHSEEQRSKSRCRPWQSRELSQRDEKRADSSMQPDVGCVEDPGLSSGHQVVQLV